MPHIILDRDDFDIFPMSYTQPQGSQKDCQSDIKMSFGVIEIQWLNKSIFLNISEYYLNSVMFNHYFPYFTPDLVNIIINGL